MFVTLMFKFILKQKNELDRTWETHSITGEIKRQGPHQLATNSTRTGTSEFRTVLENWLSLISLTPPHVILNLPAEEHRSSSFLGFWGRNKSFFGECAKQRALNPPVGLKVRTGGTDEAKDAVAFRIIASMIEVRKTQVQGSKHYQQRRRDVYRPCFKVVLININKIKPRRRKTKNKEWLRSG